MVAKQGQSKKQGLEGQLSDQETKNLKVEPWRATLETDLMEFCYKERALPYKHGWPIRNAVGYTLMKLYDRGKAKTIRELLYLSKGEYLNYVVHKIKSSDRVAKGESVWNATNRVLKKHGFKMYTSGAVVSYPTGH